MSVDLLDLKFGLERALGVEIPQSRFMSELQSHFDQLEAAAASEDEYKPELTVKQLFDMIGVSIQSGGGEVPPDAWATYVRCIADCAGVEQDDVRPQACLFRDLPVL